MSLDRVLELLQTGYSLRALTPEECGELAVAWRDQRAEVERLARERDEARAALRAAYIEAYNQGQVDHARGDFWGGPEARWKQSDYTDLAALPTPPEQEGA